MASRALGLEAPHRDLAVPDGEDARRRDLQPDARAVAHRLGSDRDRLLIDGVGSIVVGIERLEGAQSSE
ncbi:MAG: hypothetical protein NXI30_16260 [bacterium]|nr:hypothetical protein [bacterium]